MNETGNGHSDGLDDPEYQGASSMFARIASILALFAISAPAFAATSSPDTMALVTASIDSNALQGAPARQTLIRSVRSYCEELRKVYPRNSPAEDQWITDEIQGKGDRVTRALSSAEWGRKQTGFFLDACLSWTAQIQTAPNKSRNYVALAYSFARFSSDSDTYARKNSIDPEKYGLPYVPRLTTEALLIAALNTNE